MPVETATAVEPKLASISGISGEMIAPSRISIKKAAATISASRVGRCCGGAGECIGAGKADRAEWERRRLMP
jgi:hypothetical protein